MSWVSQLKHYVFDRVLASAARSAGSMNPQAQSVGQAAIDAATPILASVASTVAADLTAHRSPLGLANDTIGAAEDGLKAALDGYIAVTVGALPVIGGFIAPEAVHLANATLDSGRDHFLTWLSGYFGHKTTLVNAAPPAPEPAQGA